MQKSNYRKLSLIRCLVSLFECRRTYIFKYVIVASLAVAPMFSMTLAHAMNQTTCPDTFALKQRTKVDLLCEYRATLTSPFEGRPSQSAEGQKLITAAANTCRSTGRFTDGGDLGTTGVFVQCRVDLTQEEIDRNNAIPDGPTEEERRRQEEEERAAAAELAARNAPFVFDLADDIRLDPAISSIATSLVNVCEGIRQQSTRSDAQSDLLERCIDINREGSQSNKLAAVSQIAAQQYSDIGQSLNFLNTIQVGNIGGRLAAITPTLRQNARDVAGVEYPSHPAQGLLAKETFSGIRQVGGAAGDEQTEGGRFGVFVLGTDGDGDKRSTQLSRGFDYQSSSLTVGLDYMLNETTVLGVAYGYGDTESNFSAGTGLMQINTDSFTAYAATALKNQWSLDMMLGVGDVQIENIRNMDFVARGVTVDQTANSEITSDQSIVSIGLSKFYDRWLDIDLAARLNFVRTDSDRFAETIDGSAPGFGLALEIDQQRSDSVTSDISLSLSRAFSVDWGVVIPQVKFSWVHEYESGSRFMTGRFLADTSTLDFEQSGIELGDAGSKLFRVPLEQLEKDYGNVLLGVNALLPGQFTLNTSINRTVGITGFDHTYWSLSARKDF